MPVLPSSYRAPFPLVGGHLQTIYPSLFRRVPPVAYERERIETPDGDFLDLDWALRGRTRGLVVLSHGLEGSSEGHYMHGMIHALHAAGWDAVAWNYRGCSGEPNRLPRFYHSGATEDLAVVVDHVLRRVSAERVALVGFSLGGNLTLKYLGERSGDVDRRLFRAVALSVPCDLTSSSLKLGRPSNRIYMWRFLGRLRGKIREKMERMPGTLDDRDFRAIQTFKHFDDRYTAPLHGFRDAEDYWTRASSRPVLSRIRIPALLVNARNDPFLDEPCFPYEVAEESGVFFLETPEEGGHLGFSQPGPRYWSEERAVRFLAEESCA